MPPLSQQSRRPVTPKAVAIFSIPMATYRELLQQVREQIDEIGVSQAGGLLEKRRPRSSSTSASGTSGTKAAYRTPCTSFAARSSRASSEPHPTARHRSSSIAPRAAVGFAAKTLEDLGYEHVTNLDGGIVEWKRNGLPVVVSESLAPAQRTRYSRHLLIPEVGEEGQLRLLERASS